MEDAMLYVDAVKAVALNGQDLKSSIDDYDSSSVTRGKTDIDLSNKQMFAYHHWESVLNGPLMKGGYGKSQ